MCAGTGAMRAPSGESNVRPEHMCATFSLPSPTDQRHREVPPHPPSTRPWALGLFPRALQAGLKPSSPDPDPRLDFARGYVSLGFGDASAGGRLGFRLINTFPPLRPPSRSTSMRAPSVTQGATLVDSPPVTQAS